MHVAAEPLSLRYPHALAWACAVVLAALAVLLSPVAPAHADVIVGVNSTDDGTDANPGDGSCDISAATAGDQCTLRAAIEETNALAGADAIQFAIPGTGVHRITPDSALPGVTDRLEINGYSQTGAVANTNDPSHADNAVLRIELSGEDSPGSCGLATGPGASGTVIAGLVINRFWCGVDDTTSNGTVTVKGSFIGTSPSGRVGHGNAYAGILVDAPTFAPPSIVIGGTDPADRNLISGNGGDQDLTGGGIVDEFGATRVEGNFIGTQADGASPLGNDGDGILLIEDGNAIGGMARGANVIAFNEENGVDVGFGSAWISRNRIFSNVKLGIDLKGDGRTVNDPLDADTGPNELQNFPALTRAVTGPHATTIKGILRSTPSESFMLEFFANQPGGHQGERFIGTRSVTTGADGTGAFSFSTPQRVAVGSAVTATADSNKETSEFSAPRTVTSP